MRRSKSEIYLHLVWATQNRQPWVTTAIERDLYRCIENEAQQLDCVVLALNGMPDRVHLVVQMPTVVSAAQLAKQVKGVSSSLVNDQLEVEEHFRWQENYAVFSVSRSHLKRVIAYVRRQKQHHARGTMWGQWEETDEEVPGHRASLGEHIKNLLNIIVPLVASVRTLGFSPLAGYFNARLQGTP